MIAHSTAELWRILAPAHDEELEIGERRLALSRADFIAESPGARDDLRERFGAWLSTHESGL
jgi:hypothetical protein